jgi:hypothetical protein
VIALLGAIVVVAAGGAAYAALRSGPDIGPAPHWGLYSDAEWRGLTQAFERRGFASGSVRLVTGTGLKTPLAVLAATSARRGGCVAVARGTVLGPTLCRLARPIEVFTSHDDRSLVTLVRSDVRSVTEMSKGYGANVNLVSAAGGIRTFNTFRLGPTRFDAHGADGDVLAAVTVR